MAQALATSGLYWRHRVNIFPYYQIIFFRTAIVKYKEFIGWNAKFDVIQRAIHTSIARSTVMATIFNELKIMATTKQNKTKQKQTRCHDNRDLLFHWGYFYYYYDISRFSSSLAIINIYACDIPKVHPMSNEWRCQYFSVILAVSEEKKQWNTTTVVWNRATDDERMEFKTSFCIRQYF